MIVEDKEAMARLESKDNLINKLSRSKMEEVFPEEIVEDRFGRLHDSNGQFVERTDENTPDDDEDTPNQSSVEVQELYKNRTGPKNVPPMIQTLALEHAAVSSERSAGATFNLAHQTVNYYKHGGGSADRNQIQQTIDRVHTNAVDAMLTSIGLIKDKLPNVKKAVDLSKIAADMSRIIEKTTPKDNNSNSIKVIVFAPPLKGEADYEEVEVVSGDSSR